MIKGVLLDCVFEFGKFLLPVVWVGELEFGDISPDDHTIKVGCGLVLDSFSKEAVV